MKRKIAAILSLDVVDYTKRMSEDAETTLNTLQRILDDVIRPLVHENKGRIFKLMGDGALVEFVAATDAINAASQIFNQMRDEDVTLRGGLHVGDVISKWHRLVRRGRECCVAPSVQRAYWKLSHQQDSC
ncbi:adenylate/guanylate cyclase domain-containing protein [Ruegeria lacuscaerulensis]|uniref:adenylate/guanylate cyclase domain-containing protein n=1 Tax=Ruegeria lacuscaerulensis TaxID=55218 RepID=UPI00147A5BC0|nr:adenylate/guanylate cyclase domain-containing protein [Ruegeria lacuscaerulensis]